MKPPIVTLGGWGFGPDWFDPVLDRIAPAPSVTRLDVQELVLTDDPSAALTARLEDHETPPLLVAWSLGALLALESLCRQHDTIAHGLLLSPCPRFTAAEDFPSGAPAAAPRAMQRGLVKRPERTLADFFKAVIAPGPQPWPEAPMPDDLAALDAGLAYLAAVDLRATLAEHGASLPPLTCLAGEDDQVIAAASTFALQSVLPHVEIAMLPDRGHAFFAQEPAPIAALVTGLLAQLEAST